MERLCAFMTALTIAAAAQTTRYLHPIFDSTVVTSNVTFGQAPTIVPGVNAILMMDIYRPANDTASRRPAILIAHGGSFVSGTRASAEPLRLATAFARRGYVTASFDYRLGLDQVDRAGFVRATYRAAQDAAAAVGYVRSQSGILGVDTSLIFLGGFSAGAILSLHHAYWDQQEIPPEIDTSVLGLLDRGDTSGRISSRVSAVINVAGALGDTAWIDSSGTPVVSAHGTADLVVPYGSGGAFGVQSLSVYGSSIIHRAALDKNVRSAFLSLEGRGHSIDMNSPDGDSIVTFVAAFLFDIVNSATSSVRIPRSRRMASGSDGSQPFSIHRTGNGWSGPMQYIDLQGKTIWSPWRSALLYQIRSPATTSQQPGRYVTK